MILPQPTERHCLGDLDLVAGAGPWAFCDGVCESASTFTLGRGQPHCFLDMYIYIYIYIYMYTIYKLIHLIVIVMMMVTEPII
jgi:hypothetical protein